MGFKIAIDGPAGAGKSTVAKRLASRLKCIYVDTGAMYRAMGLYLISRGVSSSDMEAVSIVCKDADITIMYENGNQIVYLNGEDVNSLIRTEDIGKIASDIGKVPAVREKLVDLQRIIAENADVVMDGRDIGTVVLPDAQVKIYLTADKKIRAFRRYKELGIKGIHRCFLDVAKELEERDRQDMTRDISPLRQADDAIVIDSSDMDIEQVVDKILALCSKKET